MAAHFREQWQDARVVNMWPTRGSDGWDTESTDTIVTYRPAYRQQGGEEKKKAVTFPPFRKITRLEFGIDPGIPNCLRLVMETHPSCLASGLEDNCTIGFAASSFKKLPHVFCISNI
jgi:hypothetical protein